MRVRSVVTRSRRWNGARCHARSDALDSVSSLTSISSRDFVETYESLKEEIIAIEQSQIDLLELVDAADKIVSEKFTPAPRKGFFLQKGIRKDFHRS